MTMVKANLNEVKAQLSKYLELVETGEVVVICKRNLPVAEIRSVARMKKKPAELGWAEGKFELPDDFKELSAEEIAAWEGDENDPLRKYGPKPLAKPKAKRRKE